MMKLTLFVFMLVTGLPLVAQVPVKNFTLTHVMDGSTVSIQTYTTSGVVVLFTSNACPYDGYYINRIKTLVSAYEGKIQFIFINSYQEPEEGAEKMKEALTKWGMSIPYLADKEQVAMGSLGAKRSPEVFLLKCEKGNQTVFYNGAIDDNPQMENAVGQYYLKVAIDKLLAGNNIDVPTTRATGCTIRRR